MALSIISVGYSITVWHNMEFHLVNVTANTIVAMDQPGSQPFAQDIQQKVSVAESFLMDGFKNVNVFLMSQLCLSIRYLFIL